MDSGNGPVKPGEYRQHTPPGPGWSVLNINTKVPVELKFLVNYYKNARKLPTFSYAVRQLLETHPELARIAAELYTNSKVKGPVETPLTEGPSK
jgi:hypothetical protein